MVLKEQVPLRELQNYICLGQNALQTPKIITFSNPSKQEVCQHGLEHKQYCTQSHTSPAPKTDSLPYFRSKSAYTAVNANCNHLSSALLTVNPGLFTSPTRGNSCNSKINERSHSISGAVQNPNPIDCNHIIRAGTRGFSLYIRNKFVDFRSQANSQYPFSASLNANPQSLYLFDKYIIVKLSRSINENTINLRAVSSQNPTLSRYHTSTNHLSINIHSSQSQLFPPIRTRKLILFNMN